MFVIVFFSLVFSRKPNQRWKIPLQCKTSIFIKLFNNHKKVLLTYGDNNLASTIRTIYGKTIYEDIIEFSNHEDSYIRIYGYVGRESIARGSRNNQSIYVNNRYIKKYFKKVIRKNLEL